MPSLGFCFVLSQTLTQQHVKWFPKLTFTLAEKKEKHESEEQTHSTTDVA